MRDIDIRPILGSKLRSKMGAAALMVEELGLCQGDVFVDIAVIDGRLEGYEIKSDHDSLRRFARQRAVYSKVLARASIVVTEKHMVEGRKAVPAWWGILLAQPKGTSLEIVTVRKPRKNPAVDPTALVQLLWRDEALHLLDRIGKAKGMASKPRRDVWARLSEEVSLRELQSLVCAQIKRRGDWRSASKQIQCGDSYPL